MRGYLLGSWVQNKKNKSSNLIYFNGDEFIWIAHLEEDTADLEDLLDFVEAILMLFNWSRTTELLDSGIVYS